MSAELRDRFLALPAGAASADEVARYLAEVDATGTEPTAVLDDLTICWHPTARHKQVRFVDAERIEAGVRELFARPSADAPYLAAVFVGPHELSLRTFENIVPPAGTAAATRTAPSTSRPPSARHGSSCRRSSSPSRTAATTCGSTSSATRGRSGTSRPPSRFP